MSTLSKAISVAKITLINSIRRENETSILEA
jgi:hypothetical protein